MAKTYEFVVLLSPELTEQQVQAAQDSFISLVKKYKGKVVSSESWGKRPLAYKVKKLSEATYLFFVIELEAENVMPFDRDVRLNPLVLRYLVVLQEEHYKKTKEITQGTLPEVDAED